MNGRRHSNPFSPFNAALSVLLAAAALLCLANPALAGYVTRFSTTDTGAITFTGNTLGLNKTSGQNNPGTAGSIGAFITTTYPSSKVNKYPSGTTLVWSEDSSSAQLNMPAGSTVLYAELIWGGSYKSLDNNNNITEDVSGSIGSSITMTTPSGSYSVAPDPATEKTCGDSTHYFYVNSANVTAYVQSAGAGTYTVGGVPAAINKSDDHNNCAGWTLAVVYRNTTLPMRSLSAFVGCEFTSPTGGSTASAIAGFYVSNSGTLKGRLMVSALEGDYGLTGDQMLFGPVGAMQAVSGPNNPASNFFRSMINGDSGNLDTSGTFGSSNPNASGARQGWDITNIDISSTLRYGQTSGSAQGTSQGDGYAISGIGIQVDVGTPTTMSVTKTVSSSQALPNTNVAYTVTVKNTGSNTANIISVTDTLPGGFSYVNGSTSGTLSVTSDPSGKPGPTLTWTPTAPATSWAVGAGKSATLIFHALTAGSRGTYKNSVSVSGENFVAASALNTAQVQVVSPVMSISKSVDKSSAPPGAAITYTITYKNIGDAPAYTLIFLDNVPAKTTYATGSAQGAGTTIQYSHDGGVTWNSSDAAPVTGVRWTLSPLAVGAGGTLSYKATVN